MRHAQTGHADLSLLPVVCAGLLAGAGLALFAIGAMLLRTAGKLMGWL